MEEICENCGFKDCRCVEGQTDFPESAVKPQRIFNCDSGWSIDLDMVTYIGIPVISNGKATLKIGMDSNVSKENKDLFIVHEQNFEAIFKTVKSVCFTYFVLIGMKKELDEAKKEDKIVWESIEDERAHYSKRFSSTSFVENRMKLNSEMFSEMYIEAEFKIFHSAFKKAWNKWKNYKEAVEEARNSLIAIQVKQGSMRKS